MPTGSLPKGNAAKDALATDVKATREASEHRLSLHDVDLRSLVHLPNVDVVGTKVVGNTPLPPPIGSSARTPPVPPFSTSSSLSADEQRLRSENAEALRQSLQTTRGGLWQRLASIVSSKERLDTSVLEPIQEALIGADVGSRTTEKIVQELRQAMEREGNGSPAFVWRALREQARRILLQADNTQRTSSSSLRNPARPGATRVCLVVGVNGVGKTTTIGKLASLFVRRQQRVLLVAADTFRAAAVAQLEAWGRRVGCEVVKGADRADPSSVVFDAIQRGMANGVEQVIIDTAGRLHTQTPLMEELSKVYRTAEKALSQHSPDEVLLVVDATNGQNALQQAKLFCAALPVSGIALTKLDGSAKGGIVLAIADEYHLPVRYVGVGEKVEDLRHFDADTFLDALFAEPERVAESEIERESTPQGAPTLH